VHTTKTKARTTATIPRVVSWGTSPEESREITKLATMMVQIEEDIWKIGGYLENNEAE
jgi:hypothetical protein